MKILILTSINPLLASDPFVKIANHFESKEGQGKAKVGALCYPFFAEIGRMEQNKEYLPTLFSMMRAATEPKMRRKLFDRKHMFLVGNSYRSEKFDLIVSFDDINSETFCTYTDALREEEDLEEFAKLVNVDDLYTYEDAEYNFVTIDHLILFLEEAFHGTDKNKTK